MYLFLEFLFRSAEHVSVLGVLNECAEPRAACSRSGWNCKRDLFRRSAAEIDRAYLFEDSRHGDVRQRSAGIFSADNLGFTPVVGERDVQNSPHAFEVLVRG